MFEVELRALISDVIGIQERLKNLGYAFIGSEHITDIYYAKSSAATMKDISMDDVDSFSLRLRILNEGHSGELNVKVIVKESDHSGWRELETTIGNPIATDMIIKAIGFKELFRLTKLRTTYRSGSINAHIDEIEDFGAGVELETFGDAEVKDSLIQVLLGTFDAIGIPRSSIVNRSLTFLVMQQRVRFE